MLVEEYGKGIESTIYLHDASQESWLAGSIGFQFRAVRMLHRPYARTEVFSMLHPLLQFLSTLLWYTA